MEVDDERREWNHMLEDFFLLRCYDGDVMARLR
jgi:hypothetical protein